MGNPGHGISGQTRRNQCGVLDLSIPSPQQRPSSGDRHMQKAGNFDPVDNVKICGGCAACCCPQGIVMQKFHGGFRVRFLTVSAIIWAAGWRLKLNGQEFPFSARCATAWVIHCHVPNWDVPRPDAQPQLFCDCCGGLGGTTKHESRRLGSRQGYSCLQGSKMRLPFSVNTLGR
jgi:hypothetical protein